MPTTPHRRRFETAEQDGTTVVKFIDPLLDEQNSWIIKKQVAELAAEPGRKRLLLDFCNVKFASSAVLSALMSLYRATQDQGVAISLCNLAPELEEVFRATRLDDVLDIQWSKSE